MRLLGIALLAAAFASVACSANQATSNVGTMDDAGTRACAVLHTLAADRPHLAPAEVKARVAEIYGSALASANPVLKAMAVALYSDVQSLGLAGVGGSLAQDVAAMQATCGSG